MNRRLFSILFSIVVSTAAILASAMDLPVKNINGKPYFYYVVKKNDTVYSLLTTLGITRPQLLQYNPSAADMLYTGQTLYFPVSEFGDGKESDKVAEAIAAETEAESQPSGTIVHHVQKGETLYGIGRKYEVDPDLIVELNPSVRNGLKAGTTILIPVGDPETEEVVSTVETVEESESSSTGEPQLIPNEDEQPTAELTPINPPIQAIEAEDDPTMVDESEDSTVVSSRAAVIAVMLPFMLETDTPSKSALHFTDFYKGLLIAADTLSNRGDSLKILAYDTADNLDKVKSLLKNDEIRTASVIIAPENSEQIATIAAAVSPDTKVVNVFNVKDSLYQTSAVVVQTNVPHKIMYAKAIEAIDRLYGDRVPVLLSCPNSRNEKAEFVAAVAAHYRERGIEPVMMAYEDALIASQLEELPANGSGYLVIPSSGSVSDFNRFAHAVIRANAAADGDRRFAVFGYPDWTAFRGETKTTLHQLDATVYSRFYYDAGSFDTECFNRAFKRWYGSLPVEVLPDQAVLGFDTGNMLIRDLRANDGMFSPLTATYKGVQSSYGFTPADDGGWFNSEVYILQFTPGEKVNRINF